MHGKCSFGHNKYIVNVGHMQTLKPRFIGLWSLNLRARGTPARRGARLLPASDFPDVPAGSIRSF